jgi:biopolymer transport protein ExbD
MKKLLLLLCAALNVSLAHSASIAMNENSQSVKNNAISVSKDEQVYWNSDKVDDVELQKRLKHQSENNKTSSIDLRGDRNVRYERISQVLYFIFSQKNINTNFIIQDPNQYK